MNKKLIGIIFAAVLMLLFTACGASDNTPSAEKSTSAQTSAVTQKETGKQDRPAENAAAENTPADTAASEGGRILVAYFSVTGNTKQLAEYAADALRQIDAAFHAAVKIFDFDEISIERLSRRHSPPVPRFARNKSCLRHDFEIV